MRRMVLAGIAVACVAVGSGPTGAQAPPVAQTATAAQSETLERLIGNWRIEWTGRPAGGPAFALMSISAGDSPHGFGSYGHYFRENGGLATPFTRVMDKGTITATGEIQFSNSDLGTSSLRMNGDGSVLTGTWQRGNTKGGEIWQRQEFFSERARVSLDKPPAANVVPVLLGNAPLRLQVDSTNQRLIILDVYSPNAWGTYASGLDDANGLGFEGPEHLCQNSSQYQVGFWEGCRQVPTNAVVALRFRLSVGPNTLPGRRVLTIGRYQLPFDLVLTNRITATLRFVEDGTSTQLKELPFYRKFRIEAVYAKPPSGTTREVTLTWDGNGTPRKIILKLMDGGIFRSDPLTVEPPR